MALDAHRQAELSEFAAIVADIARTLESPHDAEARIGHVLGLVRCLVPCDRCALCTRPGDRAGALTVVPELPAVEREQLAQFLAGLLQYMDGDDRRSQLFDSRAHLALPVIGLDEILGVLLVDREHGGDYESHHLRLLSAVASQLGAYLTTVRLHHDSAQQTTTLADREQRLRDAARFREEFIGVVGHDLRNPLSAISTAAHLLTRRAQLEPRDSALAERVILSTDRMSRMIDDLMDFARGRLGGGLPLRRTLVDLHALCRDVAEEAQTAHRRQVRVQVSGNPRGHWDSDRLAQLLSNLVGNALQHSPHHSAVTVTVSDDEDSAVIAVNNAGPPIPPGQLERLFEPFYRGDTTGDASSGLGLGLYIVERIVDAHGGTIAVRSNTKEGTTFDVRLPRRRASDRGAATI